MNVNDPARVIPVHFSSQTLSLPVSTVLNVSLLKILPPETDSLTTDRYKSALRKCFHSEGKSCIIFERNFYTQHLQLQV